MKLITLFILTLLMSLNGLSQKVVIIDSSILWNYTDIDTSTFRASKKINYYNIGLKSVTDSSLGNTAVYDYLSNPSDSLLFTFFRCFAKIKSKNNYISSSPFSIGSTHHASIAKDMSMTINFHSNGRIESIIPQIDGMIHGFVVYFNKRGRLLLIEYYEKHQLYFQISDLKKYKIIDIPFELWEENGVNKKPAAAIVSPKNCEKEVRIKNEN